jgi:hypothetical protein
MRAESFLVGKRSADNSAEFKMKNNEESCKEQMTALERIFKITLLVTK